MKSAKYEVTPGALAAYLASKPAATYTADLYTFALNGNINSGTALTYATGDVDIRVPYGSPITYGRSVLFDSTKGRGAGHWKLGLDVATWQFQVSPNGNTLIGGKPWLSAARAGALRGAVVTVDRCWVDNRPGGVTQGAPAYLAPLGVVTIFTGRVAEVDVGRSSCVIQLRSMLELLNAAAPRNVFAAGCRWTLFDSGCALAAASFAVNGTMAAGTSTVTMSATLAAPTGSRTYAQGRVVMTSGDNKGFARAVRSYTPGTPASLTLIAPFPYAIANGDTFTAYPGCDKSLSTCTMFANSANFGGQPYVPAPETAV